MGSTTIDTLVTNARDMLTEIQQELGERIPESDAEAWVEEQYGDDDEADEATEFTRDDLASAYKAGREAVLEALEEVLQEVDDV